jgi:ABC-type multidrug transport system fused ATPase/permease subunit
MGLGAVIDRRRSQESNNRRYKPSGTLLIDGVSSSLIPPTNLYRRTACLFQDYQIYPLTLAENVGLGQSDLSLSALEDAIVSGGAEGVLAKVGLNGRLSMTSVADYEVAAPSPTLKVNEKPDVTDKATQAAKLKRSTLLSGGQWQRVALARAFMKAATADLVVFECVFALPLLNPVAQRNSQRAVICA